MTTLTGPAHHVRVGHTDRVPRPAPCPTALCACLWHAEGDHVRGDAVEHAATVGHVVLVAEGCTRTWIEVTS